MFDELLPNMCQPKFDCGGGDCALYSHQQGQDECKYYSLGVCTSAVAQVNAMTILMKNMGVNHETDSETNS